MSTSNKNMDSPKKNFLRKIHIVINEGAHVALGLLMVLLISGCRSSPASIKKELISEMKQMTEILNGVSNQSEFDAVKPSLENLTQRIIERKKDLMERMNNFSTEELKEDERDNSFNEEDYHTAIINMTEAAMRVAVFGFRLEDDK